MLLLHIAYSEEDAAARIQFAFGQSPHAGCLYVLEIHRKKSHPFCLAMGGKLRLYPLMKSPFRYLAAASFLFLAAPPVHAELPPLMEKPWLGYFVGLNDRKLQFGITSKGKAILLPLKRDGTPHSRSNPINVNFEILETAPDGKVVGKQVREETLASEQPASENPEVPVKITGKVTGDAAFELTVARERGGFSLSGKITDKGTLTNPLQFVVTLDFDPHKDGPRQGADDNKKDAIEKFEEKIKRDELRFETVASKRGKIEFMDTLNPATLYPDGFTRAELRTGGYGGVTFELEAVGKSKIVFEDKGEQEFWKGFSTRWSVNGDGDPAQAKLLVTAN